MRVSFEHNAKSSGIISKFHYVDVITTVQFSDEEMAIINSRKLKGFTVLDRGPDAVVRNRFERKHPDYLARLSNFELTVKKLMKGPDTYSCETPAHAKSYEQEVTDALKKLKDFILGSADTAESKTFEI